MSHTLGLIQSLVANKDFLLSDHAREELDNRQLLLSEIIQGVSIAIAIEDSPDYPKGPCVLVLQKDGSNNPIHVLWGVRAGTIRPAVIITAYRPDPTKWMPDFVHRRFS